MSYKICIDPGHGGNDSGALGPSGLEEADVALSISIKLAEGLIERGLNVFLTRTADVFVELADRCEIANDFEADYFLSVHLNSDGATTAGIETLYASSNGKAFAAPIQAALISATGDKDRGLKKRTDLYVLNGTEMPAILTEVGFICNPEFEAKFADTVSPR
jgi:N-acetylmuramoyl-L-alanine amidase